MDFSPALQIDPSVGDSLLKSNFDWTENSCQLRQGVQISEEDLASALFFMLKVNDSSSWAIGDIGLEMERRNMDSIAMRLCKATNRTYSHVKNMIRTCSRVPLKDRDSRISFTAYQEIFCFKSISEAEKRRYLEEIRALPKPPKAIEIRFQLKKLRDKNLVPRKQRISNNLRSTGLRGFPYEPRSEAAVVVLFGMLAQFLGFRVIEVRSGFPDCVAERVAQRGRGGVLTQYEKVVVEFEYLASNFFEKHRHDYRDCDMIICWDNDVPNPPHSIQIMALSQEIEQLRLSKPALFFRDGEEHVPCE